MLDKSAAQSLMPTKYNIGWGEWLSASTPQSDRFVINELYLLPDCNRSNTVHFFPCQPDFVEQPSFFTPPSFVSSVVAWGLGRYGKKASISILIQRARFKFDICCFLVIFATMLKRRLEKMVVNGLECESYQLVLKFETVYWYDSILSIFLIQCTCWTNLIWDTQNLGVCFNIKKCLISS